MPEENRTSGDCIGCHATGTPEPLRQEAAKPSLPGVQCESCHGPLRAHATPEGGNPPAMKGVVRHPQTEVCERCHSAKSPHFQGFVYRAMQTLVHQTGRK